MDGGRQELDVSRVKADLLQPGNNVCYEAHGPLLSSNTLVLGPSINVVDMLQLSLLNVKSLGLRSLENWHIPCILNFAPTLEHLDASLVISPPRNAHVSVLDLTASVG